MEVRKIDENLTRAKFSTKKDEFIIKQLKFFGATPTKENSLYTYFEFNGNLQDCKKYLGLG